MKIRFLLPVFIGFTILLINEAGCQEKAANVHSQMEESTQKAAESQSEQAEAETAVQELSPKIVVENDVHDFGDINPNTKQKCQFHFSNQGLGVLEIEKIQSTCGCTVPELKKKTYLPDESGTIDVTYSPGQRSGRVSKHLYILSNDKQNSRAQLTIKANVVRKISYTPQRFKLRLDEENTGVGDITIKSLDDKAFAISKVQIKPDCMSIDYDPVTEANEFVLTPHVDMEKIKDVKSGTITIYITHPSEKTITIPFNLLPPFTSDPATLIALKASPGKPIRKTLYILSSYDEDFEIESITPGNDAIKVISEEHQADKYVIIVDIVPPSDAGDKKYFNSKLTVKFAGGEELVINCIGSIQDKTPEKTSN
jgi:hypothetical protein